MITPTEGGYFLFIKAQPNASKNEVVGPYDGALKIKVKAPAVEGKANEALVKYLKLILSPAKVTLLKGETARHKKFFIETQINIKELEQKLLKKK